MAQVKFVSKENISFYFKEEDLDRFPDSYLSTLSRMKDYFNNEIQGYDTHFNFHILKSLSFFYSKGYWPYITKENDFRKTFKVYDLSFNETVKYLGLPSVNKNNIYDPEKSECNDRYRCYQYGAIFEIEEVN